jgi:hypothetical protein
MRARGDRPRAIVDRIQPAVSRARGSRLAVALVVLTVVAAGVAGALVTVDFRPDPYTELEFADELRVGPEGQFTATVAVENHEGRATTYALVVFGQRSIRTGEGVRIKRTRRLAARSRSLRGRAVARVDRGTRRGRYDPCHRPLVRRPVSGRGRAR